MKTQFEKEVQALINRYSLENGSDTPDFILAQYLQKSLENFDAAVKQREEWYGRQQKITDLPVDVPFPTVEPDYNGTGRESDPIIDYPSTTISQSRNDMSL